MAKSKSEKSFSSKKRTRPKANFSLIYGYHPIEMALLHSGAIVSKLLIFKQSGSKTAKLMSMAKANSTPVTEIDEQGLVSILKEFSIGLDEFTTAKDFREKVNLLIQTSRGVLALVSRLDNLCLNENQLYDSIDVRKDSMPFYIMLDGIEDPHNLGAILRIADQFKSDGVILNRNHRPPLNNTIAKTSAGTLFTVPIYEIGNLNRGLLQMKQRGCWVFGADMKGQVLWEQDFDEAVVLVMGNEGKGLSQSIRDNCDGLVSIPSLGKADSLNVSVATGILSYEIRRNKKLTSSWS